MKKYFKWIGIIELSIVSIAIVAYTVFLIKAIPLYIENPLHILNMFIALICFIFFAPALGLLFISHSNNLIKPNECAEQNQPTYKIEMLPKSKKMEQFKVGDMVECIDKKVKTDYGILDKGSIVCLYDDSIGVVFQTKKGNYTLRLKEDQIK